MRYENITTDEQLRDYCADLAHSSSIAFDTEFVSEDSFRPQLCLVQVCSQGKLAILDPLTIDDMTPFWKTLLDESRETVVHSGRGEVEFCIEAVGQPPSRLFDVQLAAGLVGVDYPAGYAAIISRLLGEPLKKHETRTDWRRRPLSSKQIEYALDDARYLPPLRQAIFRQLTELGRVDWLDEETANWLNDLRQSMSEERWRKVAGQSNLNGRALAIVRELWRWRQDEARRSNRLPRRVLRDDLIVELARRQTADVRQIQAVRGMEWDRLRRRLPQIVAAIERGLAAPEEEPPPAPPRETLPQLGLVGQLLSAALGSVCRRAHVAPSLVGTPSDVRDWIVDHLGLNHHCAPPLLSGGWRAQLIGTLFDDLLSGRKGMRIGDPTGDSPLIIADICPEDGSQPKGDDPLLNR